MAIDVGQVAIQFQSNLDEVFKQLDMLGARLDKVLSGSKSIKVEIDPSATKSLDTIAEKVTHLSDSATKLGNIVTLFFDMLDGKIGNVQKQLRTGVAADIEEMSKGANDSISNFFETVSDGVKRISPLILGSLLGITVLVSKLIKSGFDVRALIPSILLPAASGGSTILELLQKIGTAILTLNIPKLLGFAVSGASSLMGIAVTAGILFGTLKGLTSLTLRFLSRKPQSSLARFTALVSALSDGFVGLLSRTKIIIERFGFWTSLLITTSVGVKTLTAASISFGSAIVPIMGVFSTSIFAFRLFSEKVSFFLLKLRAAAGDGRAATTLFLRGLRQMFPIFVSLAKNARPIAKLIDKFAQGGFIKNVDRVRAAFISTATTIKVLGKNVELLIVRMERGMERIVQAIMKMRGVADDTFTRIGRKGSRDAIDGIKKVSAEITKLGGKIGNVVGKRGFGLGRLMVGSVKLVRRSGVAVIKTIQGLASMAGGGLLGAYFFGKSAYAQAIAGWGTVAERLFSRHLRFLSKIASSTLSHVMLMAKAIPGVIAMQLGLLNKHTVANIDVIMATIKGAVLSNITIIAATAGAVLGPLALRAAKNIAKAIPALVGTALSEVKPALVRFGVVVTDVVKQSVFRPTSQLAKSVAATSLSWLRNTGVRWAKTMGESFQSAWINVFGRPKPWMKAIAGGIHTAIVTVIGNRKVLQAAGRLGSDVAGYVADGFKLAGNLLRLAIVAPFSAAAAKTAMKNIGMLLGRTLVRGFSTGFKAFDLVVKTTKSSLNGLLKGAQFLGPLMFKGLSKVYSMAKRAGGGLLGKLIGGDKVPSRLKGLAKGAQDFGTILERELSSTFEGSAEMFQRFMLPVVKWFGSALDKVYEGSIGRMARGGARPSEKKGAKEERLGQEVDTALAAKVVQDVVTQLASRQKKLAVTLRGELSKAETTLAEETDFQGDLTALTKLVENATKDLVLNLRTNTEAEKKLGMTFGALTEKLKQPIAEAGKLGQKFGTLEKEIDEITGVMNFLEKGVQGGKVPERLQLLGNAIIEAEANVADMTAKKRQKKKGGAQNLRDAEADLANLQKLRAVELVALGKRKAGVEEKSVAVQGELNALNEKLRGLLPEMAFASDTYTKNMQSLSGTLDEEAIMAGDRETLLRQNSTALRAATDALAEMEGLVPDKELASFRGRLEAARGHLDNMDSKLQGAEGTAAGYNTAMLGLTETMTIMDGLVELGEGKYSELTNELADQLIKLRDFGGAVRGTAEVFGANQKTMGKLKANFDSLFRFVGGNIAELGDANALQKNVNEQLAKTIQGRNERERTERLGEAKLRGASDKEVKSINREIDARNAELVTLEELRARQKALKDAVARGERIMRMETDLRKGTVRVTKELMEATGLNRQQLREVAASYKEGNTTFGQVDSQLKGLVAELDAVQSSLDKQRMSIEEQTKAASTEAVVAFTTAERTAATALGKKSLAVNDSTSAVRSFISETQKAEKRLSAVSKVQATKTEAVVTKAAGIGAGLGKAARSAKGAGNELEDLMAGLIKVAQGQMSVSEALDGAGRRFKTNMRGKNSFFMFMQQFKETGDLKGSLAVLAEMENAIPKRLTQIGNAFITYYKTIKTSPAAAKKAIEKFGIDAIEDLGKIGRALAGLDKLMTNSLVEGISKMGAQEGKLKDQIAKVFLRGVSEGISTAGIQEKMQALLTAADPSGKKNLRLRKANVQANRAMIDQMMEGLKGSKKIGDAADEVINQVHAKLIAGAAKAGQGGEAIAQEIANYLGQSLPKKGPLRRGILAMGELGTLVAEKIISGAGPLSKATTKFVQVGIAGPLGKTVKLVDRMAMSLAKLSTKITGKGFVLLEKTITKLGGAFSKVVRQVPIVGSTLSGLTKVVTKLMAGSARLSSKLVPVFMTVGIKAGRALIKGLAKTTLSAAAGIAKTGVLIARGLGKGLMTGAGALRNATSRVLKLAIRDQLPSSLPKFGPLRQGILKMRELGPLIGESMLRGVGYLKELTGKFLSQGMIGVFQGAMTVLGGVIKGVTKAIVAPLQFIAKAIETVITLPGKILSKIAGVFTGFIGAITKTIAMVIKSLLSFVSFIVTLPLKIAGILISVVGKVLGVVVKMISESISKLFSFVDKTSTKLVQMQRQAVAVGVDINQYDRLTRAFEMLGVNASEVQQSFLTLRSTITQTINEGGIGEMASLFAKIGVHYKDLETMKPDEMFMRIVEALRSGTLGMKDQERLLQSMGAQFGTLKGAVMDATADIHGSILAASKIPPIGKEGIRAAGKFKASIELAKQAFERIKIVIFEELAPFLDELFSSMESDSVSWITKVLEYTRFLARVTFRSIREIVIYIRDNWIRAEKGTSNFWQDISALANGFFTFVWGSIKTIFNHAGALFLKWLEIIWAAIPSKFKALLGKLAIGFTFTAIKSAIYVVTAIQHLATEMGKQLWVLSKAAGLSLIKLLFGVVEKGLNLLPDFMRPKGGFDLTSGLEESIDKTLKKVRTMEQVWADIGKEIDKTSARTDKFYDPIEKHLLQAADIVVAVGDVEDTLKVLGHDKEKLLRVLDRLDVSEERLKDHFAERKKVALDSTIGGADAVAGLDKLEVKLKKVLKRIKEGTAWSVDMRDALTLMARAGLIDPGDITEGGEQARKELSRQADLIAGKMKVGFAKAMEDGLAVLAKGSPAMVKLGQSLAVIYGEELKKFNARMEGAKKAALEQAKSIGKQKNLLVENANAFRNIVTLIVEATKKQSEFNAKTAEMGGGFALVDKALADIQTKRAGIFEHIFGEKALQTGARLKLLEGAAKSLNVFDASEIKAAGVAMEGMAEKAREIRNLIVKEGAEAHGVGIGIKDIEKLQSELAQQLRDIFGRELPAEIRQMLMTTSPITQAIVDSLVHLEKGEVVLKTREALGNLLKNASQGLGFGITDLLETREEQDIRINLLMKQLISGGQEQLRIAAEQLRLSTDQEGITKRIRTALEVMTRVSNARKLAEREITYEQEEQAKLLVERRKEATGKRGAGGAFSFAQMGFDIEGAKEFSRQLKAMRNIMSDYGKDLAEIGPGERSAEMPEIHAAQVVEARKQLLIALKKEGFEFSPDFNIDEASFAELKTEFERQTGEEVLRVEVEPFVDEKLAAPLAGAAGKAITGFIDGSLNEATRAAREKAREAGVSFNEALFKVGQIAKGIFDTVFNDIVANFTKNLQVGLGELLSSVLGKASAAVAQGALAVGMAILSRLQESATVVKDTVEDAVSSTEEIRGVISGTTTVAIKETEEAFRASMRGTEKRLDTIIGLMKQGRPITVGGSALGSTGGTTI